MDIKYIKIGIFSVQKNTEQDSNDGCSNPDCDVAILAFKPSVNF